MSSVGHTSVPWKYFMKSFSSLRLLKPTSPSTCSLFYNCSQIYILYIFKYIKKYIYFTYGEIHLVFITEIYIFEITLQMLCFLSLTSV